MMKQKRIELKKLPDTKKIDCIVINILPFKEGIDNIFRKISEVLVRTLENSIQADRDEVESFVRKAHEKLGSNPSSVDEIEAMHKDAMEIETNKGKYAEIFARLQKKNLMIKQMTGQGTALQELESLWEQFEQRLASFNEKIEDQKKRLREELERRTVTVSKELDRMFEKW